MLHRRAVGSDLLSSLFEFWVLLTKSLIRVHVLEEFLVHELQRVEVLLGLHGRRWLSPIEVLISLITEVRKVPREGWLSTAFLLLKLLLVEEVLFVGRPEIFKLIKQVLVCPHLHGSTKATLSEVLSYPVFINVGLPVVSFELVLLMHLHLNSRSQIITELFCDP